MLNFFRKYQTYFFAVITVVIIISFSFFGTYNTLPANTIHEQIAFTAIDGTQIKRHELDEFAAFLGTDNDDKRLFGGMWGPNFLNDGVIKNDFLETGLAEILVNAYPGLIDADLQTRSEKEKRYILYKHPYAKFLTVENAWAYFAPEMKTNFDSLRAADKATSPEAINARINLFLEEKRFSAPLLAQVLRYQQKQYNWLTPDPNLERIDFSLFGYHTLDDWFGPRFLRLVSEFIINSSILAEQKGYHVSKSEALADLMHNAELSFQQNLKSPHLGVTNSIEYFNEQLRRLGMDKNKAIHVWQQVMLFRRLFDDVGNSVFVDPLMQQNFNAYAKEAVSGDLYKLPPELQFSDYRTLQKFEVYLDAVAKRSKENEKDLLSLPTVFLPPEKVKRKNPALVQKNYVLEVAQIQKHNFNNRVGLKETWNWEVADENWPTLKKEFPDLGVKPGKTREERFAALDSLDDITRGRVDTFSRKAIVDSHLEWISEALSVAEPNEMSIGISTTGGKPIFNLENREELIALLDKAPLSSNEESKGSILNELAQFTGDNDTYYRIKVIKRAPLEEILTFAEANREGILDALLEQQLEVHYVKIRETKPEQFQRADKTWKSLAEVKDLVADSYFEKLLKSIRQDYAAATGNKGQQPATGDLAASVRFYAYARDVMNKLKQSADTSVLVRESSKEPSEGQEIENKPLVTDQWKLIKESYKIDRSMDSEDLDREELFAMAPEAWSVIHTPVNGDLYFFQLKGKGVPSEISQKSELQNIAYTLMSDDSQRTYMHRVLRDIKEKNAISLEYLNSSPELTEPAEKTDLVE